MRGTEGPPGAAGLYIDQCLNFQFHLLFLCFVKVHVAVMELLGLLDQP